MCRTSNLENQSLVFESVKFGSLYNIVHENLRSFSLRTIIEIIQSVCDALIYLHEQKIIHCYVNSHSIMLVGSHLPKLANFEYAIEKADDSSKQKRSKVTENYYVNCAYNWLAPEVMAGDVGSHASDMYGFCSVIWELFNSSYLCAHYKSGLFNRFLIDSSSFFIRCSEYLRIRLIDN